MVSTLIICQLFSCVSGLCGLGRSICSVAGNVIFGADGIFGYISFLASCLYGGGEVVSCVVSNDWDLLWSKCF